MSQPKYGAVCGRPAGPGSGCAPACRNSRLGPSGLVGGPNPPRAAPCSRGVARHYPATPLRPGWPGAFPGRQLVPPAASPWLFVCPQASGARGRGRRAPGFTNRAVPGWLSRGRLPARSSSNLAAAGRERLHRRGLQRQAAVTGYTDRETPPREARPPIEGWRHTTTQPPPPQPPPGTAHHHHKPPAQTPGAGRRQLAWACRGFREA